MIKNMSLLAGDGSLALNAFLAVQTAVSREKIVSVNIKPFYFDC